MPVLLQAQVDLDLSMTSNNPQVVIYDYITITTTLQNTGNQAADNVVVNFDIPSDVAIAGEFPPVASQGTHNGFYGGSTVGTWTVGTVAAGQSLTFEVTLFTLSANSTSFYGQVSQGGNNDIDSTPGNGTCCTANEDDEAGYTFPNDGSGCTYDQAFAELICIDNGTPNNVSDDTYTLSFRADGSNGEFFLFIPELNYSQTSAYSIGVTELTQLSLDIESLELIFSDEAGTDGCGETIIVTAPSCGEISPNCEITYNEISNTIDDMGTPNDPLDDTFTIVYTIENSGGGTGFVGQFGGQFCGQVPSTGTYGEEITFTANVANWGNGTPVGCQIVDNQDANCTGGYTLLPNVSCGFGNACADLELTAANTPTPGIYAAANASFTLHNDFLGEDATGIQVTFNKTALNVVGIPTVSQGSIDLFWTDNPVWNVGSLASNQTATIDFDLYTLSEDYSLYGQVTAQNETDFDSAPNNGNGINPVEDDEAIYSSGNITPPCNLTISETGLTCANNSVNSDFVYAIEVSGANGTTVDYQVLGTSFSGTIVTGQLVDVATLPQGLDFTIVVTDPNNSGCDYTLTSNIPVAPGACGNENVTCSIFDPQISNVSCTETTLTFDVLVSGDNISNNLELQAGSTEIAISPDALTTVTIPRTGTSTEIVIIDLGFSATQFQDFCLTQAFVECTPDITDGADVTLSVSNGPNTPDGIYQSGEAIFTLTNTGTSAASGLTVTFTKNEVNITGTPTATAGTPQQHWTNNPLWQVGTLAPGQSETIIFPVFTVGQNFSLYGEVTAMNETDSDSTPNNGNGSTPNEDDEAVWPSGNNQNQLPDLVITNTTLTINSTEIGGTIDYSFTIENQGDAPNMSDFVYTGFVTDDASISTPYSVQGTELVTDVINPGQSITYNGTFTINANVPNGYNYFGIIVDGGGNIPESNENNNAYLDGLFFFGEANMQGDGVDLNLDINISQATAPIFSTFATTIAVSNEGTETMTGATINVQSVDGFIFEGGNEYSLTQGEFFITDGNWVLESLAPGEIAALTLNYFTLQAGDKVIYAQISSADEVDADSNPGNGTCCTPNEDDEAVATIQITNNFTNDSPITSNVTNSTVSAFPNPTADFLTVEINSENSDAVNLEIFDVNGSTQIFQQLEGVKGVQTVKVPVSKLGNGIYLLSVRKGEETVVQRFVKM